MLLCNSICSESTNKCVYDFFFSRYWAHFVLYFFSGVCLFLKKSEVFLNAYQCYNFEEGCPRSRYSYKCKYKVSK